MTRSSTANESFLAEADLRLIAESIPHIVWMAARRRLVHLPQPAGLDLRRARARCRSSIPIGSRCCIPTMPRAPRSAWEHAARTETPYQLDYRIRRFDGEYRWHAFRGLPIRDDHGVVVKWIGTATDIDDERRSSAVRRVADRQSAEALTLLETVISKAPFGFGFVDRDFRIVRINETLASVNGIDRRRAPGAAGRRRRTRPLAPARAVVPARHRRQRSGARRRGRRGRRRRIRDRSGTG